MAGLERVGTDILLLLLSKILPLSKFQCSREACIPGLPLNFLSKALSIKACWQSSQESGRKNKLWVNC